MTTKKEFISEIIALNPNMRQVGTSDVWMPEARLVPRTDGKLHMVNITLRLPSGTTIERGKPGCTCMVVHNGIRVNVYQG